VVVAGCQVSGCVVDERLLALPQKELALSLRKFISYQDFKKLCDGVFVGRARCLDIVLYRVPDSLQIGEVFLGHTVHWLLLTPG
jgi:hypothetical protein